MGQDNAILRYNDGTLGHCDSTIEEGNDSTISAVTAQKNTVVTQ